MDTQMLFYLWAVLALGLLAHHTHRRKALEREAGAVLPFSGGYLVRKRGIPVRAGRSDGFSPLYGTVFLRRGVMEGRAVRDVALAAHEAAHALRLARGERTARLASRVMVVRWMLFGSGLTLAFLLNPAAIGVLALAYGAGLLVIPEEREASREALLILREEGVGEAEIDVARRMLEGYGDSYWLVPIVALALLGWQAVAA